MDYFDGTIGEKGLYYYNSNNKKMYYYYSVDSDLDFVHGKLNFNKTVSVKYWNEKFLIYVNKNNMLETKINRELRKNKQVDNIKINGVFDDQYKKMIYYFYNNILIIYNINDNNYYYVPKYKLIDCYDDEYLIENEFNFYDLVYNNKSNEIYGIEKKADDISKIIDKKLVDSLINNEVIKDGVFYNKQTDDTFEIKNGKFNNLIFNDYEIKLSFWNGNWAYYKLPVDLYYAYNFKNNSVKIIDRISQPNTDNINLYELIK